MVCYCKNVVNYSMERKLKYKHTGFLRSWSQQIAKPARVCSVPSDELSSSARTERCSASVKFLDL